MGDAPERRRRRLRPPSAAKAEASAQAGPGETEMTAGEIAADTTPVHDPEEPPVPKPTPPGNGFDRRPGNGGDKPAPHADKPPASGDKAPAGGADKARPPARQTAQGARQAPGGRPGASGEDQVERGLRGLVGSGSSQVSITAALRARDAARPTDDDIAAAEAGLTIVRRNWVPREDLPRR
jgi:hypothetical protein